MKAYQWKGIQNDDDNDGVADKYEESYSTSNTGWQHPWIHNARYAVLIGGGGLDTDKNWPCFWNDVKLMYEVLANQ